MAAASSMWADVRLDNRCMVYNYRTKEAVQSCNLSYKDAEHALDSGQTQVRIILEKGGCYSWSAKVFSTLSPYVQLYAPEDIASVKHEIEYGISAEPTSDDTDKCARIQTVTFAFQGHVEWIRLFVQPSSEDAPALSDTLTAESGSTSLLKRVAQKLQSKTEAGGATNVQVGWSPSFNGPQKVGVYSNLEYLFNIPNAEQNGTQWIGISSLIDRDNRSAQNPKSVINTVTYMAFIHRRSDIKDLRGIEIRPAILTVKTGAEYALDTGSLNQIDSLGLRLPIAFTKNSAFSVTPTFGFETGRNFVTDSHMPVSAAIFRWVLGTDGSYRFKVHPAWLLGTKPYTLNGTFRTRYPRTVEEFDTVYNSATQFSADKRARLYGRAELSVPLSKILAVSALYQYGDLPPSFLFFGHTLSISLKATSPTDYEH
jgi:hypothetical protein